MNYFIVLVAFLTTLNPGFSYAAGVGSDICIENLSKVTYYVTGVNVDSNDWEDVHGGGAMNRPDHSWSKQQVRPGEVYCKAAEFNNSKVTSGSYRGGIGVDLSVSNALNPNAAHPPVLTRINNDRNVTTGSYGGGIQGSYGGGIQFDFSVSSELNPKALNPNALNLDAAHPPVLTRINLVCLNDNCTTFEWRSHPGHSAGSLGSRHACLDGRYDGAKHCSRFIIALP